MTSRRRSTFLQARGAAALQELTSSKLYNFPNRRQLTPLSSGDKQLLGSTHVNSSRIVPYHIVGGARSILQHRRANKRSTLYHYPAERVLRKLPFLLSPAAKRAGRVGKKAHSLLVKLETKRNTYLRLLRFAPASKKDSYQLLFTRAQRTLQRARNRITAFKLLEPRTPTLAPFSSKAFRYMASYRRFTKNCMRLQSSRRGMVFDTSRPRL